MTVGPSNTQSRTIAAVRFPLIVCVLFVHANFRGVLPAWNSDSSSVALVAEWVSGRLAPMANEAFFFLSGFLFFRGGEFSRDIYQRKIRSRIKTLLVPYLLWNMLFLGILLVGETLCPGWTAIIDKPLAQFGWTDWVNAFWNVSLIAPSGGPQVPVDIPLWFVRDLMLLSLATPIIYMCIQLLCRLPRWTHFVPALSLPVVMDVWGAWPSMLASSAVFFAFGAYFGVRQMDIVETFRRYVPVLLPAAALMFFCETCSAARILLFLALLPLLGRAVESGKWPSYNRLSSASFVIFAYHSLLLGVIMAVIRAGIFAPESEAGMLLCYLGTPLAYIVVGLLLHAAMRKICPRLLSWMTGGRA